ncbi:hypothetical protein SAMN04487972_1433 [Paracoccus halophilus]|uniref:PLD phosphodiesterase domain-containing protein n=1 Tax=Paracoccus halophilus TaxID=376733 RepID=A0A1I0UD96_9RHOB|nr:hypothetical protein [Paracoccus halophilus]SFA61995.1 hypothetical protein SAMN04487972_1433 [Paracoccus halophilus]
MSEFLTGADLTRKIREIVGGENVKCAVAYWGDHGFEFTEDWMIVCDIVGGSTSSSALAQLGAPDNRNLKHVKDLHAKVYISDNGVIIGSANASARGLGDAGHYRPLLEVGTFHRHGGETWTQAVEWFHELFEEANAVDTMALEIAQQAYRPPATPFSTSRAEGGIMDFLDLVRLRPEKFSGKGICFLFCEEPSDTEIIREIAENCPDQNEHNEILSWPRERCFTEWPEDSLDRLQKNVIELYIGRRGRRVAQAHCVVRVFRDRGVFLTECPSKKLDLPACKNMTDHEWLLIDKIIANLRDEDDHLGVIITAEEFANYLSEAIEDGL